MQRNRFDGGPAGFRNVGETWCPRRVPHTVSLETNQPRMKSRLFVIAAVLTLGLAACQCSNKPDVGPVEEAQSAIIAVR